MKKENVNVFKLRISKRFFLSSSTVFGDIFFEFDNVFFPEEHWNDFIFYLLDMWLQSIVKLPDQTEVTLDFMDGPYEALVSLEKNGSCQIDFIKQNSETLGTISIPLIKLVDEVIYACDALFQALQKPESVKRLLKGNKVEDVEPTETMNEIRKNQRIFKDYEKLKKSYKILCEFRKKLDKE